MMMHGLANLKKIQTSVAKVVVKVEDVGGFVVTVAVAVAAVVIINHKFKGI
jgi:hypothetical protein